VLAGVHVRTERDTLEDLSADVAYSPLLDVEQIVGVRCSLKRISASEVPSGAVENAGQATCLIATSQLIAASTMAVSCSTVPPLTPTPATSWSSSVTGTPPPIAVYLPPETVRRG